MTYIMTFLIVAASAVLWRVRGGLFKEYVPANKVWYAVFFGGWRGSSGSVRQNMPFVPLWPVMPVIRRSAGGFISAGCSGAASLSRICRNIGSVNLSTICYIPHMSRSKGIKFICTSIRGFSAFVGLVYPG